MSVNGSDGSCWVVDAGNPNLSWNNGQVVHLAADGTELWRSELLGVGSVSVNSAPPDPVHPELGGSCWATAWATTYPRGQVVHWAADGTELWRREWPIVPGGVSVNPTDGSCWVSSYYGGYVMHLAADGTVLCEIGGLNGPGPITVNSAPPDPLHPELGGSCWLADGNQVVHLAGDGTELWRGGELQSPGPVSVNPTDGSCWVAYVMACQVIHFSAAGDVMLQEESIYPGSISVNPADGSCWVTNTADVNQVIHLAEDGTELSRTGGFYQPCSVSANPTDGSCWVAGEDVVVHLAEHGTELSRTGGFRAPYSVSANPTDNSCWVAANGEVDGTGIVRNSALVHVAEDGTERWRGGGVVQPQSVSANTTDGSCWVADSENAQVVHLAADGTQLWRGRGFQYPAVFVNPAPLDPLHLELGGSCWVVDGSQIIHLAADGTELRRIGGFASPRSVSVNPRDGSCWVADGGSHQVVHLSATGDELPPRIGGFSYPTSVSVNPTDGSCWVGDGFWVVHLAENGTEVWRGGGMCCASSVSVNAEDGSCWVAGHDVIRLAADGGELSRKVCDAWPASANPTDGSCWVIAHSNGRDQIVHLASDGITELWRGGEGWEPSAVSVNSADGSCWVAGRHVVHLAANGAELWEGEGLTLPWSVSANPADGSCWTAVSEFDGVNYVNSAVVHLEEDGREASRSEGFDQAQSVSVYPADGSCWVADTYHHEVVHLAESGAELWRGGGFSSPLSVSANPADGSCWVADYGHGQVVHLSASGGELWRGGEFIGPCAVSVNPADGSCWVADYDLGQIVHLAENGIELWRGGGFYEPNSVSVNPADGSCWVADTGNSQVVHLGADGTELWRRGGVDAYGERYFWFYYPYSVSVNPTDGSCWVADTGHSQVVHLVIVAPPNTLSISGTHGQVKVNGAAQALPYSGTFDHGTVLTLEAVPDTGYHFTGWSGDLTGNTSPTTVTVDGPQSITAGFAINTYTLNVTGSHGSVSVNSVPQSLPYSGTFNYEDSVALVATPDTGYHFVSWSGDASGTDASTSVTMDGPKSITAGFAINTYTLSITGAHGSVVVNGTTQSLPYSGTFNYGDSVSLTPAPDAHYHFTGWSGDVSGATSPVSLTMDGAKSVGVGYAIDRFTLSLSGSQGAVSVNGTSHALPYAEDFDYGTSVSLAATPNTGYHFSGWSGDLTGNASPTTVTVDGPKSITAGFAINTYTLNVTGSHGSVSVNGVLQSLPYSGTFNYGDSVTLEAAPEAHYHFSGWSGDITGSATPTSLFMDGAKNVSVGYAIGQEILSLSGPHGRVAVNGVSESLPWSGSFDYGGSVALGATPDAGYQFSNWSGDLFGSDSSTAVTMDGDKNIAANFTAHPDFSDVQSNFWAYDAIEACFGAGIVKGYSDGTYGPSIVVSRDQMAVFVSRALAHGDSNVPAGPATAHFSDVPTDYWAYKYISYAFANNIVVGYADGAYAPEADVTRDQMAVFIARSIASPLGEAGLASYSAPATPTFPDVPTSCWAFKYVEYCHDHGIVNGYSDGTYQPGAVVTRDQMAVFVARAFALPWRDQ